MKRKLSFIMASLFITSLILGSCAKGTPKINLETSNKLTESDKLLSQYKLIDSKEILMDILKEDPDMPEVNFRLAQIEYHFDQKYDSALEHVNKAIGKGPEKSQYYETQGDIYSAMGEYNKGADSYGLALSKSNPSSDLYFKLANSYLKLDSRDRAVKTLEEGFKVNPYNRDISAALHRLYVEDGNYTDAYKVWKTFNLVAEDNAPLGYTGEWNVLYRKALEGDKNHYAMGDLYFKIHLYDEAAGELEKAVEGSVNVEKAKVQLADARAFAAFRDDMIKFLDSYYKDMAVKGAYIQNTLYEDLMPIYDRISAIFPDIEKSEGFSQSRFDAINKAIEDKFGVYICYLTVGPYLDCYFGYVADEVVENISHWGQNANEKVIIIKDMVSRGFNHWYNFNQGGTGGWTSSNNAGEFVYIFDPSNFIDSYNRAISDKIQKDIIAEAKKLSPNPKEKQPLDVYYSPYLSYQFSLKYFNTRIDEAKEKGLRDDALKAYAVNLLIDDYYDAQILAHEGQHALDLQLNKISVKKELEYRAKLSEMAYGNDQFVCLGEFMQPSMGNPGDPHGLANTQVFTDMVKYISAHKDKYPGIDTTKNILAQMINLKPEEIKEIAINVFEEKYSVSY